MAEETTNHIRYLIAVQIIERDLFNTYREEPDGTRVYLYEDEGFNKEKIESEGSAYYLYTRGCMNEYYVRHKEVIEDEIDEWLQAALEARRTQVMK